MRLERLFIALSIILLVGLSAYAGAQEVETRHILAIRVSFPQETPDDETTSGDGTFDLRTFEEASADYRFPFDIPPHNRSYFSAHLQALAHYYATVSEGRLTLTFDVFPSGENDSYELTQDLIDYGNGRTRQETNARIVQLFRDGVVAAAEQEGDALDFSAYDDVIVIHAGLGGESSNQLNDVPSAFINPTDLDTYSDGPIQVGGATVDRGILLPESGGTDGRSGLNGILARFYANQLGLPRLDNPEDGLPAVGDWSLMDTGNITVASSLRLGFDNLTGNPSDTVLVAYAPSRLSAWSRTRLGWLSPTVVRHDTTISIAAAHSLQDLPRAVRVPITAQEYFLIENRMSRLAVEGRRPNITLSGGDRGVWIANDDYDAFIPGSGILIWHIDEEVINGSGEDKAVNSNPDYRVHFDGLVGLYRKGVALEEADGLEDIGNTSASRVISSGIISFSSISGNAQDPYYVGNTTRFGPDTTPSSNNNLGYASGIEIEVLSAPGEVMDVAIRFGRQQDDWPRTHQRGNRNVAPRRFVVSGETLILNGNNEGSNGWSIAGQIRSLSDYATEMTPAIGNVTGGGIDQILFTNGTRPQLYTNGNVLEGGDGTAPSTSPLVTSFPGRSDNDVWGYTDGTVAWGLFGGLLGQASMGPGAIAGLAAGDYDGDGQIEIAAANEAGQLTTIETDGTTAVLGSVTDLVGTPIAADLDGNGTDEVIVVSSDGSVTIFSPGGTITSRPVPGGAASPPVAADIDRDGRAEILFGGNGRIWVIRFNGISKTDTPYDFPLKDGVGRLVAPPLVADLDDDGEPDILVATQMGTIYALSNNGALLPGFPVLSTGILKTAPLLDDLDSDGTLELVAFTDDGSAHLWHLEQIDPTLTGSAVIWGEAGGNPANTNRLTQTVTPRDPEIFTDLLPESRAYCYPNPIRGSEAFIRYHLTEAADVDLTIIDPVGRIIERIPAARADVGTDNEIRWDTAAYGSGVYLCRLHATNGTRTETRFIKTAIIR